MTRLSTYIIIKISLSWEETVPEEFYLLNVTHDIIKYNNSKYGKY